MIKVIILHDNYVIQFESYYGSTIIWIIGSLLSLFLFIEIIQYINHCKCLEFVGQNTLVYFAFHIKFQHLLAPIFIILKMESIPFHEFFIPVISMLLEAICLVPVALIFNKYLYFLLGRKKPIKN